MHRTFTESHRRAKSSVPFDRTCKVFLNRQEAETLLGGIELPLIPAELTEAAFVLNAPPTFANLTEDQQERYDSIVSTCEYTIDRLTDPESPAETTDELLCVDLSYGDVIFGINIIWENERIRKETSNTNKSPEDLVAMYKKLCNLATSMEYSFER